MRFIITSTGSDDTSTHVWGGTYNSGESISVDHLYNLEGTYIIKAKAKDRYDMESGWSTLELSMPKNKAIKTPFLNSLENHPHMFTVMRKILTR